MTMTPKDLIKLLEKNGWYIVSSNGSHFKLRKESFADPIIVPYHNRDMKTGTLNKILKEAGLK